MDRTLRAQARHLAVRCLFGEQAPETILTFAGTVARHNSTWIGCAALADMERTRITSLRSGPSMTGCAEVRRQSPTLMIGLDAEASSYSDPSPQGEVI